MTWAPDYCTAADLKGWLRIGDTADDTVLGWAITAASRDVDQFCGRQFGVVAAAEARSYVWDGQKVDGRPALEVDDVMTTTNLAVVTVDQSGTTTSTPVNGTNFDLWPANAAKVGRPWTHLVARSGTSWPGCAGSTTVTAVWGWTAIPTSVLQATVLQASETFTRRNAPFGIAGSPELGSELRLLQRLDVDAARLLAPYKRHWGAA